MSDKSLKRSSIKIGISACLLGNNVRYDGGHRKNDYIVHILGKYIDFVPVCPEVGAGFGIPRERIRLEGNPESPRVIGIESGADKTEKIRRYSERRTNRFGKYELSGFIFKRNSPSCGLGGVKVHDRYQKSSRSGRGLFADVLMKRFPLMPAEDEARLNNPGVRENFITRIYAYNRLHGLFKGKVGGRRLHEFHSNERLLLMAHDPRLLREIERLLSKFNKHTTHELLDKYSALFMEILRFKTSTVKNAKVLHHIFGYLEEELNSKEENNVRSTIVDYRNGRVPLIKPLTLLRGYAQKYRVLSIANQTYFNPFDGELRLRYQT